MLKVVSRQYKVGQEEGPLAPIEIASSSEYKSESKANITSSPLPIYTLSPSIPPPSLLWQPLDQCPIVALTSKSQRWISSGEHELCNSQENLTKNYNSVLPTIYMKSSWSVL